MSGSYHTMGQAFDIPANPEELTLSNLADHLPGMDWSVVAPCLCLHPYSNNVIWALGDLIVHLNDEHNWTYSQIADFLEHEDDPYAVGGLDLSFRKEVK